MLEVLRPLAVQFEANGRQLLNAISDMSSSQWLERLGQGSNHAAFLALHLLDARCHVLGLVGVSVSHGFEEIGKHATRLEDIPEYPTPSDIARSWRRVSDVLTTVLAEVTADRLERPSPHRFPVDDATILGAISFLAHHEAYHLGQLGLIRAAIGMTPLSFS